MNNLQELKQKGHDLLDEYVSLDKSFRTPKERIKHAYDKLNFRLSKIDKEHPNHFAMMKTEKEVETAIIKLESMIIRRKKKNEYMGFDKIQFAPNLKELQKNIKQPKKTWWQRLTKMVKLCYYK